VKQCQEQFNFTLRSVALERRRTKFMHKLCCVDFFAWSGRSIHLRSFVLTLHCYCIFSFFCSIAIFVVFYYHMWWIKIFKIHNHQLRYAPVFVVLLYQRNSCQLVTEREPHRAAILSVPEVDVCQTACYSMYKRTVLNCIRLADGRPSDHRGKSSTKFPESRCSAQWRRCPPSADANLRELSGRHRRRLLNNTTTNLQ